MFDLRAKDNLNLELRIPNTELSMQNAVHSGAGGHHGAPLRYRDYIGYILGLYRDYIRIMEKKMET